MASPCHGRGQRLRLHRPVGPALSGVRGDLLTPFIGDYRTDLTAHVFRSLAEAMGAAVHVSVTGADDHHKTEAVYKAFGRALRQAIRIEGDAVPSTKGVL
jgi:imidazoleglycerol-phosphate dehydratase/histidinol-phosphatase